MRPQHVFLITLLLSVALHAVYWRYLDDSPDQQQWMREMKLFSETSLESQRKSLYYGYPATTILGAAAILQTFGISSNQAFAGIMAVGISVPVALSVLLCFQLRPKSLWYVGAGAVLIPSQAYYNATPPSALVTAFSTFLLLYALYIYENKKHDVVTSAILGSVFGIALATRIDISLVVLFFVCVFLFSTLKKHILVVLLFAAVLFVLCDPYMHVFPLQHMQDIFHKITHHAELLNSPAFPYRKILLTIPLCSMGFAASVLLLLFPNKYINSVSRVFLAMIIALCTSLIAGLVMFSAYYPAWYFFPVLQIFEVLFTLFLLDALEVVGRKRLILPVLGVVIIGNTAVFFAKLFL
ncbi:MAG: hypothetical protein AAB649_06685 [Patescibacteria group bacterium]